MIRLLLLAHSDGDQQTDRDGGAGGGSPEPARPAAGVSPAARVVLRWLSYGAGHKGKRPQPSLWNNEEKGQRHSVRPSLRQKQEAAAPNGPRHPGGREEIKRTRRPERQLDGRLEGIG